MSPQEVSSIDVDGKSLSNANELATLTDGFNDVQWFAYNHGGVATPVSITVLTNQDGRVRMPLDSIIANRAP